MSGIIALRSEETVVSIVESVTSMLSETGGASRKFVSKLTVALELINECKTCSGDVYTKLDRTFGESLELVAVVVTRRPFLHNLEVDMFFQALTFNSTISSLDLFEWEFSTQATNLLAQALRVNNSLSSLHLSRNSIGAGGANSLSQALRVNTSLSSLELSNNSIGDEGANLLAQALRVNTSLSFWVCVLIIVLVLKEQIHLPRASK